MACETCEKYQSRITILKIVLCISFIFGVYILSNARLLQNRICSSNKNIDIDIVKDPFVWQYYTCMQITCNMFNIMIDLRDMLIHMVSNFVPTVQYQYMLRKSGNVTIFEYLMDIKRKIK